VTVEVAAQIVRCLVTGQSGHHILRQKPCKFCNRRQVLRPCQVNCNSILPAHIERHVQNSLREFRVSGNSSGESTEWYECSVICAEDAVDFGINKYCESVRNSRQTSDCVNISERVFELLCEIYSKDSELVLRLREIDFELVIAGLRQALNSVTDSESLLFVRLHGIDEAPRYTLHQFAYLNEFSVGRAKKSYASALRKLRHPSRAIALTRLLDQA
jgi:hypothetical protein